MKRFMGVVCALMLLIGFLPARADTPLLVAVAADFVTTFDQLAKPFVLQTHCRMLVSSGSSEKLYMQIMNGAPYDVFLSAGALRPTRLDRAKQIVPGSRMTYAKGRLVFWTPNPPTKQKKNPFTNKQLRHIALANPLFAPYGMAAKQVLQTLKFWKLLQPNLVFGESVSQAFSFVKTGNAQAGFVALSQIRFQKKQAKGSVYIIPQKAYSPIRQQAVLLNHARNNRCAVAFMRFLKQDDAQKIIQKAGYFRGVKSIK
jgi:molybdate transport system substrate-binding protein